MPAAVALTADDLKRLATLQARAAMAGAVLEVSTDDADRALFVVTTGPVTLRLVSMEAVDQWLDSIGAPA